MEISAKILKDSISPSGVRITTFELVAPRIILAEINTHRVFSRNSASSRAVPAMKKIKMVWDDPYIPVHWGANKAGMSSDTEISGVSAWLLKTAWVASSKLACISAYIFNKLGLHKQWANRCLETYEYTKIVLTATEYDNWFWLRDHKDAQPEIQILASRMNEAMVLSVPTQLYAGEWHLPYVDSSRDSGGVIRYCVDGDTVSLDVAQKVSASCCAQVSYRVMNTDLQKAHDIFDKLVYSDPLHASPFEHQATPIIGNRKGTYTHKDVNGNAWSGNLRGWSQYRHLVVPKLIQQHKTEQ